MLKTAVLLVSLCALGLWQTATSWLGWIKPLFLASPAGLCAAFASSVREPYGGATLPAHVLVSLGEVLVGFAGGVAVGIPLGVGMGWSPLIGRIMSPFFNTVRQIPPLAWVPLAVVWFGIGFAPKAFVIFIAAVVPSTIKSIGLTKNDVKIVPMDQSLIVSSFWILSSVLYGPITITSPAFKPDVIIVRWRSLAATVTGVTTALPSFMR